MNIRYNLVLVYGEDKTDKIKECDIENSTYYIKYKEDSKIYKYDLDKVIWANSPIILSKSSYEYLLNNNNDIETVLQFDKYKKVIFNSGKTNLYLDDILISKEDNSTQIETERSIDCLEYLKELSNVIGIEDEYKNKILSKQYNKLADISIDSILYNYINLKQFENRNVKKQNQLIFPFGFNLSQKQATLKAINEKVSIIEGPPGTGKTQTILNIIANIVISGKTVAVVSNNNSAVSNVQEKLQKNGLDFITAYLGSSVNKNKFLENQSDNYPDISKWNMNSENTRILYQNLYNLDNAINTGLEIQNNLAVVMNQIEELKVEKIHFEKSNLNNNYLTKYKTTSDKLINFMIEYKAKLENEEKISFFNKIIWHIKYGIKGFNIYNIPVDNLFESLELKYYELKLKELEITKKQLEYKIDSFDLNYCMSKYSETSMKLFKAYLNKKYNKKTRIKFSKSDLYSKPEKFNDEYPVIFSTTHSLKYCLKDKYTYDYVIMDEASQVDILTGTLALSCAKNIVIVGDLKQLPNVITNAEKEISDNIYNKYNLNEAYRYSSNSILSSMLKLFPYISKTLLKEHYRCNSKIIGFCNKKFYDNKLVILSNNEEKEPLMLYKTVKGNHERNNTNQRQIDIIVNEILTKDDMINSNNSIGIISPYRLQAEEINKCIKDSNIQIDTVHKFQGREKDIIIITTVANEINDFIDNANLVNVAVSRAIKKLIVIVSADAEDNKNSNIVDLIKYIRYNNGIESESKINSIFDLLYSSYSDKLLEFYLKNNKVSKYDSENLANSLIEKVLSEEEFSELGRIMHQPLKKLIKDTKDLTEKEKAFVNNHNTHIDFLIFNKITKEAILSIEVDGYKYHDGNEKQLARDEMKDTILEKYNIPLLRLKTNGSGEQDKIYNKLKEIVK